MAVAKADWQIFDDAIGIIETKGWTNQPSRGHGVCLWIAIYDAAPHGAQPVHTLDDSVFLRLNNVVKKHFGVSDISEVFDLNDMQPMDTGKQWAIMNLADLRDRAIRELAISEKPFPARIFIRLWNGLRRKK
jgi:hypothetical protein